jgi:hypothetical protein
MKFRAWTLSPTKTDKTRYVELLQQVNVRLYYQIFEFKISKLSYE